jgi:hypothetical protein
MIEGLYLSQICVGIGLNQNGFLLFSLSLICSNQIIIQRNFLNVCKPKYQINLPHLDKLTTFTKILLNLSKLHFRWA